MTGVSCAGGNDRSPRAALGTSGQTTTTAAETTTTAPPATTTTTSALTPEEEVLAAYQGYWSAVDQALAPPQVQPDLPALRQFATGDVLAGIVLTAENAKAENSVLRVPDGAQYSHRAEVVAIDGTATVRDCSINDAILEVAGTGEVLDDDVSTRLYIAMLVQEDGTWKVATLEQANGWEGVAGCALD